MVRRSVIRYLACLLFLAIVRGGPPASAVERSELDEEATGMWDARAEYALDVGEAPILKEELLSKPSPPPPAVCAHNRREFVSGYYEASTGGRIPEVMMNCEESEALGCKQYRNRSNTPESETARTQRLKKLSCCKSGMLKGMGELYKVMQKRDLRICSSNFGDGQGIGRSVCNRTRECYTICAVFPTCMQLGYLVARAACDSTFRSFVDRFGIAVSERDERPLEESPLDSGRAKLRRAIRAR